MAAYHRVFGVLAAASVTFIGCSPQPRRGCSAGTVAEEALLWCHSFPPDATSELTVIRAAVARMRAKGGVCITLAEIASSMLQAGRVHLFDRDAYPGAGAAPIGQGVTSWLLLSRELITSYFDSAHPSGNVDSHGIERPQTLQLVLAHEADHINGEGHSDDDGYLTRNTLYCSDVGGVRAR